MGDSPDGAGKLRFIVQSVPITLLCCRGKQLNGMLACDTKMESASQEMVSEQCSMLELLLSESLVRRCLDTDRIKVPALYLITEMLMQSSKLALIFMGLQAGE